MIIIKMENNLDKFSKYFKEHPGDDNQIDKIDKINKINESKIKDIEDAKRQLKFNNKRQYLNNKIDKMVGVLSGTK